MHATMHINRNVRNNAGNSNGEREVEVKVEGEREREASAEFDATNSRSGCSVFLELANAIYEIACIRPAERQ